MWLVFYRSWAPKTAARDFVCAVQLFESISRGSPLALCKVQTLAAKALANGYVLSKLSAESFVQRAFEKGLQGTILRPGMLWGNSRTGASMDQGGCCALLDATKNSCFVAPGSQDGNHVLV